MTGSVSQVRQARADYEFTDGLADVIVELAHDRKGAIVLVPFNEDAQPGCIALAAAAYAVSGGHALLGNKAGQFAAARIWPWAPNQFRHAVDPSPLRVRRRDLVRSAALLIKAIEAIDRAEAEQLLAGSDEVAN